METLPFPRSVFGDFEDVYSPAEDTFLLLDALELDLAHLRSHVTIGLECGSGSGAVITALSKALGTGNRLLIATDINFAACSLTKKCALYNRQSRIETLQANLGQPFHHRLENQVDLLVFNPPYVPTDSDELRDDHHNKINLSWAGGQDGRVVIDNFLMQNVPQLLSKPNGVAYLVALDRNNINQLTNCLSDIWRIKGTVVIQRRAGTESLHVIKYSWIN